MKRKKHHTSDCVIRKTPRSLVRTFFHRNIYSSCFILLHTHLTAMDSPVHRKQLGGFMKFLGEYRALLIKMLLLTKRKRGQTIAEFLLGYVFLGLLLAMRFLLDRTHYPARQIAPFRPYDYMLSNSTIANVTYYYPSNFIVLLSILNLSIILINRQYMCTTNCANCCKQSSTECAWLSY